MALEVIMREEAKANLVSVAAAMLSAARAQGGLNIEYCRGTMDAIRASALGHRILWADIQSDLRVALVAKGQDDLLDLVLDSQAILNQ